MCPSPGRMVAAATAPGAAQSCFFSHPAKIQKCKRRQTAIGSRGARGGEAPSALRSSQKG